MTSFIPLKISYKREKLKCLLKTQDHADCTFICGSERIPAHKLILACSSPVFELMFFGQMAATEIELPDITPDDFRSMLEYIYTDNVDIKTMQNAWSLIYISQKYFLSDLLELCVEFVKKNLTISNLLISYEYGQLYDHQELMNLCWQDIMKYTKSILFVSDYHMKESTLNSILSQAATNASESDLIIVATKWAIEECTINEREINPENIWNIFSENKFLKYLNINNFEIQEYQVGEIFAEAEPYCSINYVSEIVNQLKCYYGKELNKAAVHEKRKPNLLKFKFRDVYRIAKNVIFSDLLHVKNFITSNRSIYIFGVAISTLHRPQKAESTTYSGSVRIKFTCNNCDFYNCTIKDEYLEYDHIQLIDLPMPVKLERAVSYKVYITYENEPQFERGEVVLQYLGQRVADKRNSTVIQFNDELDGSVLQAVSYYPA